VFQVLNDNTQQKKKKVDFWALNESRPETVFIIGQKQHEHRINVQRNYG